jgi:D-alanine-D-alanine ligase
LFGGRSGEHEVSLQSARSVMGAFNPSRYQVVPIAIDRQGRWLQGEAAQRMLAAGNEQRQASAPRSQAMALLPGRESLRDLDVVFPLLHGPLGEDGTVQGLLELAGIPYVGSGVLASALAMDKAVCKALFAAHRLPQAPYQVVKRKSWRLVPDQTMDEIEFGLGYPVFVKPANLGSSVGVSKAHDRSGLALALDEAARYDRKMVVERGIDAREIEVSVLGNDQPIASVPGEVVPSRDFYDYTAKYIDTSSQLLIPAPISRALQARARHLAVQAFLALDACGMARVDFLLDRQDGELYLNEVNTIPGFTVISMYPKLWEASGIAYPELIDRLIALALERHRDMALSETTYSVQAEEQAADG